MSCFRIVMAGFFAFIFSSSADAQTDHERYSKQCIKAVEDIRDFSCADGVVIPVTLNGRPVTAENFTSGMNCDRPALLDNGHGSDGQCVPGSRILNHSTETAQVSVMCRQKHIRPDASLLFDEIDVIAHNPATGATCWFQAKSENPDEPLDGKSVISPTNLRASDFWAEPEAVADDGCGNCHDNDPFMYSPFVGQVWQAVPANPLGPYYHVDDGSGFDEWPTKVFDIRDNTCLGCHRIGKEKTCGALTDWMTGLDHPDGADLGARQFPLSHAMPPEHGMTRPAWITFHGHSVSEVRSCCEDPEQQMCNLIELERYAK